MLGRRLRDDLDNSRSCTTRLVLPGLFSYIEGRAVDVWRALPSVVVSEYIVHHIGQVSLTMVGQCRTAVVRRQDGGPVTIGPVVNQGRAYQG